MKTVHVNGHLKMKFTFKRNSPTGPYRSFHLTHTDIKVKGQVCGSIDEGKDTLWSVRVIVKSTEAHCGWKWVSFKRRFKDEAEAREFVLSGSVPVALKSKDLELHFLED